MKKLTVILLSFALAMTAAIAAASTVVFINEIHYDNAGTDTGEAIEIAGPAGTSLTNWTIELYNGNGGTVYNTLNLSGTIPNQQNGFGTLSFSATGIQNSTDNLGDGMALVNSSNDLIQFLSYEGSFTASDGAANGRTSTNIGVAEDNSTTPVGYSLQLSRTGSVYEDFMWTDEPDYSNPRIATFGAVNSGQSFVPIPGAVWLLGSGLIALVGLRRKLKK